MAFYPYPLPKEIGINYLFFSFENLFNSSYGSSPGDNIKISGIRFVDSLYESSIDIIKFWI